LADKVDQNQSWGIVTPGSAAFRALSETSEPVHPVKRHLAGKG